MKNILVVITTAFVPTGGLTTVMMNYYRMMNKEEVKIDFASTNNPPQVLLDEIHASGSEYCQLPDRKNVLAYFFALKKLCRGYDGMHVNDNSDMALMQLHAAIWAGINIRIIDNHSSRSQHNLLNQLFLSLYRRSFTQAVACSDEAGEWLYGKNGFITLRNAINAKRFKFDVVKRLIMRHNFGFGDDEYVIGHIGKFMEAKNHPFLIEVFTKYHALQPKSKLLLIGDGELRHLVEAAIDKNKVNDCVILAGLRSDIPDVLQAIDIFLFPSIYEGMPLSVVEAQASGLPCIISDAVTKMVNIGEDVIQLPLSKGADYWAEYLGNVKYELSRQERCERNTELITKAGYNIETEAENLMRIYKNL